MRELIQEGALQQRTVGGVSMCGLRPVRYPTLESDPALGQDTMQA
jgi:hypothetical protein